MAPAVALLDVAEDQGLVRVHNGEILAPMAHRFQPSHVSFGKRHLGFVTALGAAKAGTGRLGGAASRFDFREDARKGAGSETSFVARG